MDSIFPIHIFPADSLAASVTTTVWVGVWVVTFFNLRLGWVASGLVIPGYLVPLLLVRPWTVFAIYIESVVTFALVYCVSESFHARKPWSSFFGRDRFFALVLVSILVRAVFDGWLFPQFGAWMNEAFEIHFDYQSNLHSFGLIIVSLLANYFWKPGLVKGTLTMSTMVGLSLLIVRFGLMEFTNFSLGNLQFMYEDIATSLLASPRVYIILVVSAFIASWMNLYYGWDFNGILIPSLLALQWNEPQKLVFSFVEATVVLVLASLLMKLPPLHKMTMEGTRKILLFFNVMFVYRLLLGHVISIWFPETTPTDVFGFGFLLSTLLAVKAHQKGMLLRLMRATAQISLVGSLCGSVIGFALILPTTWGWSSVSEQGSTPTEVPADERGNESFATLVQQEFVRAEMQRIPGTYRGPAPADLMHFESGVNQLLHAIGDPVALNEARELLARANYQLQRTNDGMFILREMEPSRGWGTYGIREQQSSGFRSVLAIQIPRALDEELSLESGLVLFQELAADYFAAGGTTRDNLPNAAADVVRSPDSIFGVFHRVTGQNVIQVRALRGSGLLPPDTVTDTNVLWVNQGLPSGLNLNRLQELVGGLDVNWDSPRTDNILRTRSQGPFLELGLSRTAREGLLAHSALSSNGPPSSADTEDSIHEFLRSRIAEILPAHSNGWTAPTAGELFAFDRRVLTPLLELCSVHSTRDSVTRSAERQLRRIEFSARVLGWDVRFFSVADRSDIVSLHDERARGWGTLAIRMGQVPAFMLAVPRPIQERHVVDYAVNAFDALRADALCFAGAHPLANSDGTADVSKVGNLSNHFQTMQQALLRSDSLMGDTDRLFVQIRSTHSLNSDVVLAGRSLGESTPVIQQRLLQRLGDSGVSVTMPDGSVDTVGYELAGAFSALASVQPDSKHFVNLWLGEQFRRRFRPVADQSAEQAQFDLLDIPTLEADLAEIVLRSPNDERRVTDSMSSVRSSSVIREYLERWLRTRNVIELRNLQRALPNVRWQRIVGRRFQKAFLVGRDFDGRLVPCVVRLSEPPRGELAVQPVSPALTAAGIRKFEESQAAFLVVLPQTKASSE